MAERDLWLHIRDNTVGHWRRSETRLADGWADCLYVYRKRTGFVELKWLDPSPVRVATNLGLKPEQALFLYEIWRAGGSTHILARLDQKVVLIGGRHALRLVKRMHASEILEIASKVWDIKPNVRELDEFLGA